MQPKALIAWRKGRGETQDQAAQFLGIKTRQYQRLEKGETEIKPIYQRVIENDLQARFPVREATPGPLQE